MNNSLYQIGTPPNAWEVNANFANIARPPLTSRLLTLKTETKTVEFDLAKAAFLVIDMQNDFCHPDGWVGHTGIDVSQARIPIKPLQKLIPEVRVAGIPIVWVNWRNRCDLLNVSASRKHAYKPTGEGIGLGDPLPANQAPVLMQGSWGAEVVEELEQKPEDIYVDKYEMSGFWNTPLDSILRNLGKTTLLFAGLNADQCVMATLQNASFLGYDCILLRDCTATMSPDFCLKATFYNVEKCFGFVTNSQAVLKVIEDKKI
ncbi:cysteine hydrolase [Spirulina sp. CS-785/01]|uniref:cysteine hydrolase family protein n=1 Tax=Spirulina sp. CS-785/01 TaxID=3021716 RepID=UPI00232E1DD2|nr:isochorismatase family cysteine hydrolase [Spirulina sp. CS-785/01]MDB9314634.1 cysteine hydrolase [Spirulina sp. CS-785/01]